MTEAALNKTSSDTPGIGVSNDADVSVGCEDPEQLVLPAPRSDRIMCPRLAQEIHSLDMASGVRLTLDLRPAVHALICLAAEHVLARRLARGSAELSQNDRTLVLDRSQLARVLGYGSGHYVDLVRRCARLCAFVSAARFEFIDRGLVASGKKKKQLQSQRVTYSLKLGTCTADGRGGLHLLISEAFCLYLIRAGYISRRRPCAWHFDRRAWGLKARGGHRGGSYAFGIYASITNIANRARRSSVVVTVCALISHAPELRRLWHKQGRAYAAEKVMGVLDELRTQGLIQGWRALEGGRLVIDLWPDRFPPEIPNEGVKTPNEGVKTPNEGVKTPNEGVALSKSADIAGG